MSSRDVVLEALARMTGREVRSLTPTTRIAEDLGMRPLDRIDLLSLLEDRLGVTLSDREVMIAKTVGDLAAIAAALRHEPSLHEDVAELWEPAGLLRADTPARSSGVLRSPTDEIEE